MNNSLSFESKLKNIFDQSEKRNLTYEEILEKYSTFDENSLIESFELKLIESENRYKSLIEDSLELIQSIGVNGEILFVNNTWKKTLGYSDEEISTLNIFDIIADESKPQCMAEYEMIMHGEFIYDAAPIFIAKDGRHVYLEGNSVPRILNGEVLGTHGFFKDITKELLTESQLEDYKMAIDESAIVSITDVKGNIKYVNRKFCEISQFSEEECLLQNHNIINSKYHTKEFFDDMWNTIEKGGIWKGEVCDKAKDGSLYWTDSTIVPFLKDGNPYQYISIKYDITKRVEISEEIQKQKNFYEIVLNEIPADIVVFDKNHKYLFINPNGVKDTEIRNYLIGKDDYEYCAFKNKDISIADERRKLFLETIESKVGLTFEEELVDTNGNVNYKLRKYYPLFDTNNECEFVIGFGMDITEMKEQELVIDESLKEKETLLGEIHHRVKNNLAVIDGLLELKKFYEKGTAIIETLSEVQMRIKIIALVHEKLYQSDQFSNINLSDYLKDLTNYYEQIFNKTDGDQVSFKINVENINLDISKSITFGLLLNEFISNSLKYGIVNNRVLVDISLVSNEDVFVLKYKDSGNGLPDAVKKGEQKGFGYKLINTFIRQLKGDIIFVDSTHFEVEIRFKLK